MDDSLTILNKLLRDEIISNPEFLTLKNDLKEVFFGKAFMNSAREAKRAELQRSSVDTCIEIARTASNEDEIVERIFERANELNQGEQLRLFFNLADIFKDYDTTDLSDSAIKLADRLKNALQSLSLTEKERAIQIISLFGEISNSQSRKAAAGAVGEIAVMTVLRSLGLEEDIGFGRQFIYRGSNTDFIIPYATKENMDEIKAFIAVQASTNDRARLSSSELHKGAKRYLCSLNGCTASSKNTDDIGADLCSGYLESETYYVVINKEKIRAIKSAEDRYKKSMGTNKEVNERRRLRWLKDYSMSYVEFANDISSFKL